jgi:hypothetical protein
MRGHILSLALALFLGACASKENRPVTQQNQDQLNQWTMREGQASRVR